jgi:hypothetical protein
LGERLGIGDEESSPLVYHTTLLSAGHIMLNSLSIWYMTD